MEATSAKAYREKRRKSLPLPSGDVFVIRKLGSLALAEVFRILGIADKFTEDTTEDQYQDFIEEARATATVEQAAELIHLILTKGVAKPKIVLEDTESDDELYIEDIDPLDFDTLFNGILNFIGATAEASQEREFPGEQPPG